MPFAGCLLPFVIVRFVCPCSYLFEKYRSHSKTLEGAAAPDAHEPRSELHTAERGPQMATMMLEKQAKFFIDEYKRLTALETKLS